MFSVDAFSLKGKHAVVTGGSKGLCRQIAQAYHDLGAKVVILSRSSLGAETAAEMGAAGEPVCFVQCDLGHSAEIGPAVDKCLELLDGRIDILVNGAGVQHRAPALEFPEEEWRRVIEVNLSAMFFVSQKVGKIMCAQHSGKIINIASMCSFFGSVLIPAYSASKGGVAQLTRALSNEWASQGVNVNAIAPGYIETDLNRDMKVVNPAQYAEVTARIPMGRWGQPDDLMGLAVFLASDAANYVSGAVIPLDGGYLGK